MKKTLSILGILVLACLVLGGCTQDSKTEEDMGKSLAVSAENLVVDRLKTMGIGLGYDKPKQRIVVLGSDVVEIENAESVTEVVRQTTYRKALVNALSEVMTIKCREEFPCTEFQCTEFVQPLPNHSDKNGVARESTSTSSFMSQGSLSGWTVLTQAEGYTEEECIYEISVAVVWSEKPAEYCERVCSGEVSDSEMTTGGKPLEEYIASLVAECSLGGRCKVDDHGERWFIGTVTSDDAMLQYVDQWYGEGKVCGSDKLRAYVLDGMARMLMCDVAFLGGTKTLFDEITANAKELEDEDKFRSTRLDGDSYVLKMSSVSVNDAGDGLENCVSSKTSVKSDFKISISNPRVKWFSRKVKNPISGKEVDQLICAIRGEDIRLGERELGDLLSRKAGTKRKPK